MSRAALEEAQATPDDQATRKPDELSGWPLDPSERRDVYHRIRRFPSDVGGWRKALVSRVREDREMFPLVPPRATVEEVRSLIDDGISYLREVARILAVSYGTPRLGNKDDPVDELVYIILSRKTREGAYQAAFDRLKKRFRRWDDLLRARRGTVERLVRDGGLSRRKTDSLIGALSSLQEKFGECTLDPAREWPDDELEAFLCSLPEISRKSAYCIMLYSFGRSVFPVDTHVGRVLSRLGPYRELGVSLDGLDHKQLQAVLTDLVPPNLRYSLHVNLLSHGREICSSLRPACDRCELNRFCQKFRQREANKSEQSEAPTVIDLFCGAGGLSSGFQQAGFRVALAVDQDPVALRTYMLNHPSVSSSRVLCRDVRELQPREVRRLLGKARPDVLIGSPPCQGFSHAGFRSKVSKTRYKVTEDERNFLFESMVRLAVELRPRLFLLENVPGMNSARNENLSFLEAVEQILVDQAGFETAIWRINAASHGVPQDRVRYFLVASTLGRLPARPEEDYRDHLRRDFDLDALPPVQLEEAIFDLPNRQAGEGQGVDAWRGGSEGGRYRRYLKKFRLLRDSSVVYNHTVRYHNERDLELYALLRPGEDSVHAVQSHRRRDLMRYRTDVFDDKYARLRPDMPCKTIVAHLAKDGNGYIHPYQARSITLREAARVQSFHDGYVFCGSPSDQWIQLGNAVPPVLAAAIAGSFLRALGRNGE